MSICLLKQCKSITLINQATHAIEQASKSKQIRILGKLRKTSTPSPSKNSGSQNWAVMGSEIVFTMNLYIKPHLKIATRDLGVI